jgi:hypothetical protein
MLLKHHRPFQAGHVLVMALHRNCQLDAGMVFRTLEAGLTPDGARELTQASDRIGYDVQRLVTWLQRHITAEEHGSDEERLARIEWAYQAILHGTLASPVTLHRMLQTHPEFFAEVLSAIYRAEHEQPAPDYAPNAEAKARAESAYRLLHSWHSLPGQKGEEVDADNLMNWITKARQLCNQQDRLGICDFQLGNLFAYCPNESDGSWPCVAVRDAIEEVEGDQVTHGFEIGIYNKRGSYMKSMTEGGAQEWRLAKKYQAWAEACSIDWPKTARSLRNVASKYQDDARRQDALTQLNRP